MSKYKKLKCVSAHVDLSKKWLFYYFQFFCLLVCPMPGLKLLVGSKFL